MPAKVSNPEFISDPSMRIVEGVPKWQGMAMVLDEPHIFRTGIQFKHLGAEHGIPGEYKVLAAHGVRDQQDIWRFKDGRSIKETVSTYNEANAEDPIRALLVCNEGQEIEPGGLAEAIHVNGTKLKVAIDDQGDKNLVTLTDIKPGARYHMPKGFLKGLHSVEGGWPEPREHLSKAA